MANMYFWANSRCRIENSVEKASVFLHPLYIIGLKIVPGDIRSLNRFVLWILLFVFFFLFLFFFFFFLLLLLLFVCFCFVLFCIIIIIVCFYILFYFFFFFWSKFSSFFISAKFCILNVCYFGRKHCFYGQHHDIKSQLLYHLFLFIIPHTNFPCKTFIGRHILLSPRDNFDYHIRSIDARTG